jgi:hypothetical protein
MVDVAEAKALATAGGRAEGEAARPTNWRWPLLGLVGLVLLAIGLRLMPVVFVPSINWEDEIFQATEPAHRLVFGYGIVPWEFQLGMRSWLLPGVIAALMQAARIAGDGPAYYLPVIATAFALLATAPVICCFLWARRWYGVVPALAGAAAVAVAPELVYFGARALTEVVAAHILVIACWLLDPGYRPTSRRRLVTAGMLLGLVCLLRIHLAPAVAIIALWSVWRERRAQIPPLLVGALLATGCSAVLDWTTLGYPLASIWRNLLYNVVYGVNAEFGTSPWHYYAFGEVRVWALPLLFAAIAVFGARRLPALLVAAIVIVAVHSGIAHKEYRFIYPASVLLMTVAGIGIAHGIDWGARRLGGRGVSLEAALATSTALILGYWAIMAFHIWTGDAFVQLRHRLHDRLMASSFAAQIADTCALGLYGAEGADWGHYGGYTWLHRRLPMYWPKDQTELAAAVPAFDTLLYTAAPPSELGFKPLQCFGEVCVARRSGSCRPQPMAAMPFPNGVADLAPSTDAFPAVPARGNARVSR